MTSGQFHGNAVTVQRRFSKFKLKYQTKWKYIEESGTTILWLVLSSSLWTRKNFRNQIKIWIINKNWCGNAVTLKWTCIFSSFTKYQNSVNWKDIWESNSVQMFYWTPGYNIQGKCRKGKLDIDNYVIINISK